MPTTIGDYLFWKLATIGARQVLACGQRTLFLSSLQRNRLVHVDITRYRATPSHTEVGVFVVAPDAANLAACFEAGRQYFPGRPVVFVQELGAAEYRSVSELTASHTFATATVINNPATAAAQVESVLNTMLYESKPVYIGVAPEVLGVVIALPAAGTAGSSSGAGQGRYVMTAGQVNAASAAVAMAFIR